MGTESVNLKKLVQTVRVRSVLNKDTKNFGKQYLFDGNDSTCWNSDQGSPQHIILEFSKSVAINKFCIMFQGGFVGKRIDVFGRTMDETANSKSSDWTNLSTFFPTDTNNKQEFLISSPSYYTTYKIIFPESTDFYGRITIYNLEIFGMESEDECLI